MKIGMLLNGDLVLGMVGLTAKLRKNINKMVESTNPEDVVSQKNFEKIQKDIMRGVDLMLTPMSLDPEKSIKQALDFLKD